jgi:hypothetical protein
MLPPVLLPDCRDVEAAEELPVPSSGATLEHVSIATIFLRADGFFFCCCCCWFAVVGAVRAAAGVEEVVAAGLAEGGLVAELPVAFVVVPEEEGAGAETAAAAAATGGELVLGPAVALVVGGAVVNVWPSSCEDSCNF